jgi:hypothetical protein
MQPKPSKDGPRPAVPVSFEERNAILHFGEPLQNLLLEFVVHYPRALQTSMLRKIPAQGHFLQLF